MNAKFIAPPMFAAALAALAPLSPALAGKAAAPEAADQSQGMAILSAAVKGDGTLRDAAGAVGVTGDSGFYTVTFVRDIEGCAAAVTLGGNRKDTILVAEGFAIANIFDDGRVSVKTMLSNGNQAALPFQLIVFCPR